MTRHCIIYFASVAALSTTPPAVAIWLMKQRVHWPTVAPQILFVGMKILRAMAANASNRPNLMELGVLDLALEGLTTLPFGRDKYEPDRINMHGDGRGFSRVATVAMYIVHDMARYGKLVWCIRAILGGGLLDSPCRPCAKIPH